MNTFLYGLTSKEEWNGKGRRSLMSYARAAMWKTYEEMLWQYGQPMFADMELTEAKRVLRTYANGKEYELIPTSELEKEFWDYVKENYPAKFEELKFKINDK